MCLCNWKSRQQAPEITWLSQSGSRERCVHLAFSLVFHLGPEPTGWCRPHARLAFLTQLDISENILWTHRRCVSMVILPPVKLAKETNLFSSHASHSSPLVCEQQPRQSSAAPDNACLSGAEHDSVLGVHTLGYKSLCHS